ncbi:DUF2797 domain-containing protein [Sanyastnella coralliicola]|uniref:DUF2797 domain-containing protein n=1 Tax=Sanyastnella coralliicola TaxID=3069118 RepID=UPI0027BA5168|nr:DUF2797 domain-containing protein [Longitalea sp. SCSIO 12813]
MQVKGNLRKMRVALEDGQAKYHMRFFHVLEPSEEVYMNDLVGQEIKLSWDNKIHCVVTGKSIKKTYGEGMSFDAWRTSPMSVESIVRPELSRIHEGIALRDKEWEEEHHNKPHYVYLSLTSDVKVGVTRETNIPSRWIDQGAVRAIKLAYTPYRQLAGLIEVSLKDYMADKTNWRNMLKNAHDDSVDLEDLKDQVIDWMDEEYHDFISDDDEVTHIEYPVIEYPIKVVSMKFEKLPIIEGKLMGIKGQYLIFDNGRVINIRSQAGYEVTLEY